MTQQSIDIAHLKTWIGAQQTRTERIAPFPANALAATLNRDDAPYAEGTPLPALWHWLHFLPLHKLEDGNYDGHAALGGFLPPVPLPRRMWAGGRLRFLEPLRIGRELRKTSEVMSVAHKQGRSGDLVFVTVRHRIYDAELLALEEEHDIVYRAAETGAARASAAPTTAPAPLPQSAQFTRHLTPDPVLLFRYSALTFNGHRIHYDYPFCTGTEGYDGLVVHGPLLATLMLDALRREQPQMPVTDFSFRALAPVTCPAASPAAGPDWDTETQTAPISVNGSIEAGVAKLWVCRADGQRAMEGQATLAEAGSG